MLYKDLEYDSEKLPRNFKLINQKEMKYRPPVFVQCNRCKDLFSMDWDYFIGGWEIQSQVIQESDTIFHHNKEGCSGILNLWKVIGLGW